MTVRSNPNFHKLFKLTHCPTCPELGVAKAELPNNLSFDLCHLRLY